MPLWKRIAAAVIPLTVLLIPAVNAAANFDVAAESDNLLQAYDEYGFAYCVASGLLSSGIGRPESYSKEAVAEILAPADDNKPAPERTPNVVFVQLESFFDPLMLTNYPNSTVPVFAKLKEDYPSGYLHVPSFGGGTANTEFETLTGMSLNHFGVGEYPYETVLAERACESIAFNLKNLGYSAHALHNHSGTFYSRNKVYSHLGFDTFIPLEYMQNPGYTTTGWARDDILTDYIVKSLRRTENPDFVFAVTIQCHGKYPSDFASSGIAEHEVFDYLEPGAFNYFITQLRQTDEFIGKLCDELEKLPEDTVLVLYGDHLPPLPIPPEQLKSGSLYMTEYVIWSNFDIEAADKTLSAYELSSYVLGLIGVNEGFITKVHQSPEPGRDDALRMISYDMLYGENYIGAGQTVYSPSALTIGYDDIKITGGYTYGDYSYVRGSNFTQYSVIYTNGKRRDTEFIASGLLRTPYIFENGDAITVCQTGADKEILGRTGEFTAGA